MTLRLRFVRWLASKCACRRIHTDGDPYLDRYYLAGPMSPSLAALWPEHDRPRQRFGWLSRTWYLHRFHRPDNDRHLHNHPWDAVGMILHGGYVEVRAELGATLTVDKTWVVLPAGASSRSRIRCLVAGDRQAVGPDDYHAIVELCDEHGDPTDEVWTLFGTGEKAQSWGYLVDGEHVPWREYQARKYGAQVLELP